jgi:hypothetical protein
MLLHHFTRLVAGVNAAESRLTNGQLEIPPAALAEGGQE